MISLPTASEGGNGADDGAMKVQEEVIEEEQVKPLVAVG